MSTPFHGVLVREDRIDRGLQEWIDPQIETFEAWAMMFIAKPPR
jgi:hypothetical protein